LSIQYVHTNIIAKDWRSLADFYIQVFDCTPLDPERDLAGAWLEQLTQINGCKIRGIHLALPGYLNGPTLEIFSYQPENELPGIKQLNRFGLAHLAFHVDDVAELLEKLIAHGGKQHGDLVKKTYAELGELTVVYACDPEGNFIEIQNWNHS
jgi:predicted enzyme related to lactoylglutathione lyase